MESFYFREIAFIDFTLTEIKQCTVFLVHPVYYTFVYLGHGHPTLFPNPNS